MKLRIHLFEWPSRHNVNLALPFMLVLSFGLHAVSMFLFHTTFARSNGSAERVATITYILPGSPEAAKLAFNLLTAIVSGGASFFAGKAAGKAA